MVGWDLTALLTMLCIGNFVFHTDEYLVLFVYYLHQGGYVIVIVHLFVCLLATLFKNFQTDLRVIFRANEQMIKFGGDLDHYLGTGIVFQIH